MTASQRPVPISATSLSLEQIRLTCDQSSHSRKLRIPASLHPRHCHFGEPMPGNKTIIRVEVPRVRSYLIRALNHFNGLRMTAPPTRNLVNGFCENLLAFDAQVSADAEMIKRLSLFANRHIKSRDISACCTTISCHIHRIETSRAAKTFMAAIANIFVPGAPIMTAKTFNTPAA